MKNYNIVAKKISEKLRLSENCHEAWKVYISREVASVISNQSEAAYVIEFAVKYPQYKNILYCTHDISPIFQLITDLKGLPIKVIKLGI